MKKAMHFKTTVYDRRGGGDCVGGGVLLNEPRAVGEQGEPR